MRQRAIVASPMIAMLTAMLVAILGPGPASAAPKTPSSPTCVDAVKALLSRTRPAPFWRIVAGARPTSAAELASLYDMYGTRNLLFLDELKTAAKPGAPVLVDGYVWYDTIEQIDLVKGTRGGNAITEQLKWHKLVADDKGADIDLILRPYAPEAIARSEALPDAIRKYGIDFKTMPRDEALEKLQAALKKEFPDGYFVKVRNGYDSRGAFPNDKTDLKLTLTRYERDYLPKRRALEAQGLDAEHVQDELNDLPGYYEGSVLDDLVNGRSENLYVEQKLSIAKSSAYRTASGKLKVREREYRVILDENGKVVTSQNRWDERRLYDQAEADEAGRFAQSVSDRIPPDKRGPAGWDVVKLSDGSWKIMERNIWDVGGWYPKTNTLTANLLAERVLGSTPIQDAFRSFLAAPGLESKEPLLRAFFERDGIKPLLAERSPLTEYFLQAKEAFMKDLRAAPTVENAERVVRLAKSFELGDQFSKADLDLIAGLLAKDDRSLDEMSDLLGPFDVMTHPPGHAPALLVTQYDDAFVRDLLAARVKALGSPPDAAAVGRLVEDTVTTTADLRADPSKALALSAWRAPENAQRLAYHGDRAALVAWLLR